MVNCYGILQREIIPYAYLLYPFGYNFFQQRIPLLFISYEIISVFMPHISQCSLNPKQTDLLLCFIRMHLSLEVLFFVSLYFLNSLKIMGHMFSSFVVLHGSDYHGSQFIENSLSSPSLLFTHCSTQSQNINLDLNLGK